MGKIDIAPLPERSGTGYPKPYDEPCRTRRWKQLALAGGLTQYGVNLVTLRPGEWSSQRHWHSREDEFVWIVSGELVLVTEAGEETVGPGAAAAFPAGKADGHHLVNRSSAEAVFLAIGTNFEDDRCHYPDIDLMLEPDGKGDFRFTRKSGEPY